MKKNLNKFTFFIYLYIYGPNIDSFYSFPTPFKDDICFLPNLRKN